MLFSQPRHPFLSRTLHNIVATISHLYHQKPFLSEEMKAPYFAVICSTGPGVFTASILEEIKANPTVSYRHAGIDFADYGGRYKATNEVWDKDKNHYSRKVNQGVPILRQYAPAGPSPKPHRA